MRRWVHTLDQINRTIGEGSAWLTLVMVGVTFVVVILRYFFNLGWVWLQETALYAHAILFLTASAYTLLQDGHVRIDIFYRPLSEKRKAWVNLLGSILFLIPTCALIFYQAWPYVVASWSVFESSSDAGGIPGVFILKSFILVFCALLILQGVSISLKSILILRGEKI